MGIICESHGGQGLGKDHRGTSSSQAAGEAAVLVSSQAEGRALMDLMLPTRSQRAPWVAMEDVCAVATSVGGLAPGLSLACHPQSFPPHDTRLKSRSRLNPTQLTAICRPLGVHPKSILAEGLHGGPCSLGREQSRRSRVPRSRGRSTPPPRPGEQGAASTSPAAAPSSAPCSCSRSSSTISSRAPEQDRGWDMCRASSQPDGNHP